MNKLIDLVGQRFGRLTVLERAEDYIKPSGYETTPMWICRCDCGKEVKVQGSNLRSGNTRSCGCLREEVMAGRKYAAWRSVERDLPKLHEEGYEGETYLISDPVLCLYNHDQMAVCQYEDDGDGKVFWNCAYDCSCVLHSVTHWMPLPGLPKGVN